MKNFSISDISETNHLWVEENEFVIRPLWWQKRGLMYTSTGFGRKIPTEKMVLFNNRLHRMYCCIYSNSGTCYIIHKGNWIVIN